MVDWNPVDAAKALGSNLKGWAGEIPGEAAQEWHTATQPLDTSHGIFAKDYPATGPLGGTGGTSRTGSVTTASKAKKAATAASTPAASGGDTISNAQTQLGQQLQNISPLAMQAFYKGIIAPMMTNLAQSTQQINKQYGQETAQIAQLPGMAGYKPAQIQLAGVPNEQAASANLVNAYLGAAAMGPAATTQMSAMDQIQTLLGQLLPQEQKVAGLYDPSFQVYANQASGGVLGTGIGTGTLTAPAPTQPAAG